ncbi:hypothetical protein [Glaciecola sp. MF2-115]|uniref:hypothetical protein n=1 Tax=Glaciecola sp. MF2-115 TaxID=3384827 RepID=UPI0039A1B7BB
MNKARKQAKFRKKMAIVFFVITATNVLLKILGISSLDTSSATTLAGAVGMKFGYYSVPIFFSLIGWAYYASSQNKVLEAETIESSSKN